MIMLDAISQDFVYDAAKLRVLRERKSHTEAMADLTQHGECHFRAAAVRCQTRLMHRSGDRLYILPGNRSLRVRVLNHVQFREPLNLFCYKDASALAVAGEALPDIHIGSMDWRACVGLQG
jgi:hypothetical protein